MRFLVDGYNVTMRDPATSGLGSDEQREALVLRLATRGAALLGRGAITVVFDGRAGTRSAERRGPVEVRYSGAGSADDLIVALVGHGGRGVTVVTADGGLAARVRSLGASVLDASACFEERRGTRRGGRYPASTAGLPKGANRITEELKELWLDDEE